MKLCILYYVKDDVFGIRTMRFKGMKCVNAEWCKHNRH